MKKTAETVCFFVFLEGNLFVREDLNVHHRHIQEGQGTKKQKGEGGGGGGGGTSSLKLILLGIPMNKTKNDTLVLGSKVQ